MPLTRTRPRRITAVRLLTNAGSNSKLGPLIHSWSLPAIETCPGATDFCRGLCYAMKSHFLSPHVRALYRRNLLLSRRQDFAFRMIKEIRETLIRTVRLHVSGDFYSAGYTRKWIAICKSCPRVKFFAYTRSWRDPKSLKALLELATLPNVVLWWSEDRETGPSPVTPGVRTCFLVQDKSDEDLVDPSRHDLVFRDGRHRRVSVYPGRLKRVSGCLVCIHEQNPSRRSAAGAAARPAITCSSCQICLQHEPSRSRPSNNPALRIL